MRTLEHAENRVQVIWQSNINQAPELQVNKRKTSIQRQINFCFAHRQLILPTHP